MLKFFEDLLCPFPDIEPSTPPQKFFPFLWECTKGVRGKISAMAFLTTLIAAFDAFLIAMLGRIVDWLNVQEPLRLWADRGEILIWLIGVMLASIGIVALQTLIKHQTLTVNLPARLRWDFHRLMLGQSVAFYQDEFAGRITSKVMETSLAVRNAVFVLSDVMVAMGVYVGAMIVIAGMLDTKLVWPFMVWLVLYICALIYFVPRLSKFGQVQADARSLLMGRLIDAYTNIATVKLFSHTKREALFAHEAMREFVRTGHGEMRLVSGFEIVNHVLSIVLMIATLGTALSLWSSGSVGAGAVAASAAMALRLQGMTQWLMWEMTSLLESIGAVKDGLKILSTSPAVFDVPNAMTLDVKRGEICFEQVSFRYAKSGARVIDELNFTAKPGEKIGLIGRSGAGKSTLLNLLLRFHDLESGRILVDGRDIAQVTQESLRSQIGIVTQEASLMNRSVADNIAYGKPTATQGQIQEAAQRAEAHTFIRALGGTGERYGYMAHVGERGTKLSGGQRQRIAIARVMLKDAPILLLDEATSALDSEVEVLIQQSLNRLMEGKTVIAIAHRLSTIAAMDRLVVLDDGHVVEQGSHEELLENRGLYARLWTHQSGGFLGDSDESR